MKNIWKKRHRVSGMEVDVDDTGDVYVTVPWNAGVKAWTWVCLAHTKRDSAGFVKYLRALADKIEQTRVPPSRE